MAGRLQRPRRGWPVRHGRRPGRPGGAPARRGRRRHGRADDALRVGIPPARRAHRHRGGPTPQPAAARGHRPRQGGGARLARRGVGARRAHVRSPRRRHDPAGRAHGAGRDHPDRARAARRAGHRRRPPDGAARVRRRRPRVDRARRGGRPRRVAGRGTRARHRDGVPLRGGDRRAPGAVAALRRGGRPGRRRGPRRRGRPVPLGPVREGRRGGVDGPAAHPGPVAADDGVGGRLWAWPSSPRSRRSGS